MTWQLVRYQENGHLHFVTFSCCHRRPYLNSATATVFEESLERMRLRYRFFIAGYVVMPEHVHLLVGEPQKVLLATAVQAMKLSVALKAVQRPFWLPPYYDFNVLTQRKVIEKLRYMHRNPVTRGLVAKPEEWAWSSYPYYSTGNQGTVRVGAAEF
jgi:putative transposase